MHLKRPKASTDPRVRSLLQKAVRRGYWQIVDRTIQCLDKSGDAAWLRSRAVVITFEECWPIARSLSLTRQLSSKRDVLLAVAKATKQKDAAGLGALAHAYQEGDQSMLDVVPDRRALKFVSEALTRPKAFFAWVTGQSMPSESLDVIRAAEQYLSAATWPWDKACILAGALLASAGSVPTMEPAELPSDGFPFWVALDKHTPEGKIALREVAKQLRSSYRQLIWASFYCESARVNGIDQSPWWEAERTWRLRRAGLSWKTATEIWSRAQPIVRGHLDTEAAALERLISSVPISPPSTVPFL